MNDDLLINPSAGSFTFSSQPSNVGQSAENRAVPNGKDSAAGLVLVNKSAPVSDSDLRSAVEVLELLLMKLHLTACRFQWTRCSSAWW